MVALKLIIIRLRMPSVPMSWAGKTGFFRQRGRSASKRHLSESRGDGQNKWDRFLCLHPKTVPGITESGYSPRWGYPGAVHALVQKHPGNLCQLIKKITAFPQKNCKACDYLWSAPKGVLFFFISGLLLIHKSRWRGNIRDPIELSREK